MNMPISTLVQMCEEKHAPIYKIETENFILGPGARYMVEFLCGKVWEFRGIRFDAMLAAFEVMLTTSAIPPNFRYLGYSERSVSL